MQLQAESGRHSGHLLRRVPPASCRHCCGRALNPVRVPGTSRRPALFTSASGHPRCPGQVAKWSSIFIWLAGLDLTWSSLVRSWAVARQDKSWIDASVQRKAAFVKSLLCSVGWHFQCQVARWFCIRWPSVCTPDPHAYRYKQLK